jgi:hypothetical protein
LEEWENMDKSIDANPSLGNNQVDATINFLVGSSFVLMFTSNWVILGMITK